MTALVQRGFKLAKPRAVDASRRAVVSCVGASEDPAAALQPLFDAISPTASSDAPPAERDPKVAAESAKCLVEVVAAFGPLTGLPLKALAGNRVSRSRMN